MIERVKEITDKITMTIFGQLLGLRVERDNQDPEKGRVFLQVTYSCTCRRTGALEQWNGRKWYLSKFMTDDEIIKTAYAAFEATVKHEIMEGFKVDGVVLFNPHVDYRELLKISDREVKRLKQLNDSTEV